MLAKTGVALDDLRPEVRRLEPIVDLVFGALGKAAIVTATNHDGYDDFGEPIHRKGSLHYRGLAFDLRIKHVGGSKMQTFAHAALVRQIDLQWPKLYDVLLECPGGVNAHIHVEPSPRLLAQIDKSEV